MFAGLLITAAIVLGRRLQEGSSYPPYSSFRDDPNGTQLAYDALSALPGMRVERNLRPLSLLIGANARYTLILADADVTSYLSSEGNLTALQKLASEGVRVIVGMKMFRWNESVEHALRDGALGKTWGVRLAPKPGLKADEDEEETDTLRPSPFYIVEAKGWTAARRFEGRPVLFERAFHSGSIGLLSEPYLISNDGLAHRRDPNLMPILIGPNHAVVFDETHLGVSEAGSIAGLVRRYRLQGAIPALLLVALLFVWRNSVPFPPPREAPVLQPNLGRDSRAGLQNLLARNVLPEQLLPVCVQLSKYPGTVVNPKADPVESYAAIQRELNPARKGP